MTEQKKKNIKSWVSTWLTPSLVLGAIITGAYVGGQLKKDAETRMFEDAKQKEKTRAHIDSDYNEVRNYQLMEQVTEMKVELDTSYAFVNAIFKEDRAAKIADSMNSVDAVASRASRDSLIKVQAKDIEDMRREQRITSNAVQLILSNQQKILDTLN